MRILLIGSGGREHALAWKMAQSPKLEKLWIAPGNPGTEKWGENVTIHPTDQPAILEFCKSNQVDMVVVGPEDPLVQGLADALIAIDIKVFGPKADAAELEGSKAWCKEVMVRHRVPTGAYRVFNDLNSASSYLESGITYPIVIKASGLAAGKGVVICKDSALAKKVAKAMLEEKVHGVAGNTILVEEFLEGPEASAFAISDSRTFLTLETCMDHKARFEGEKGPNTGGMGAVSPNPLVGSRTADAIERQILLPTIHGMNHEGRRFHGILFAGIKLTPAGPKILEYNVRFGDPECQVLMVRMKSDLIPYLEACATGTLDQLEAPEWDERPAIAVILVSEGYPGKYQTGVPIYGLEDLEDASDLQVFHAGTQNLEGQLATAGGRVLAVTALGQDLEDAQAKAYQAIEKINFEGKGFRTDIGSVALEAYVSMS